MSLHAWAFWRLRVEAEGQSWLSPPGGWEGAGIWDLSASGGKDQPGACWSGPWSARSASFLAVSRDGRPRGPCIPGPVRGSTEDVSCSGMRGRWARTPGLCPPGHSLMFFYFGSCCLQGGNFSSGLHSLSVDVAGKTHDGIEGMSR